MRYKHKETGEIWSGQPSTSRTSNFYLLSHEEKVSLGWELLPEQTKSLEELKEQKLGEVRTMASMVILSKYPQHKQVNASLGIYGEQFKIEMVNYIQNIRTQVSAFESKIATGDLEFDVVFN